MCFINDGPTPEFYSQSEKTARKQQRCDECFKPIYPGERYEYVAAKWDGDFSTVKTCCRCLDIIERIKRHEVSEGCDASESRPLHGGLYEELSYYGEDELAKMLQFQWVAGGEEI